METDTVALSEIKREGNNDTEKNRKLSGYVPEDERAKRKVAIIVESYERTALTINH